MKYLDHTSIVLHNRKVWQVQYKVVRGKLFDENPTVIEFPETLKSITFVEIILDIQ